MKTAPGLVSNCRPVEAWLCRGLFLAALGVHLFCSSLGWRNAPLEAHEFRQTQTALTIRHLARDGLRLDYTTPLLGKPWSIPLEFPLHQGIAAVVVRNSPLNEAEAGRAVSLTFFYLSLPALYLLVRRLGLDRARSLLVPAFVLASPLYLFYSRAVLIESTALALSLWFLWLLWAALADRRPACAVAATACGMLAAMVKLPTFAGCLTPAAMILLGELRTGPRTRLLLWAGAVVGASLAAGLAWSAYTDGVKQLNPLAGFLRADSLRTWAIGDFRLRFDPALWDSLADHTVTTVLGGLGLLALGVATALSVPAIRLRLFLLLLAYLVPLGVFANVYRIHDYYYYANGIFLLAALGVGLAGCLEGPRWRQAAAWSLILAVLALGVRTYSRGYYPLIPGTADRNPELGRILRTATASADVIVIVGQEWNPTVPYLADRRALMIPFHAEQDPAARETALARLEDETVGALVVTGPQRRRTELIRPIIERFGLAGTPQLSSETNDVYLPPPLTGPARSGLLGLDLQEHRWVPAAVREPLDRLPAATRTLLAAIMSPVPRAFTAQFGLAPAVLDGKEVLNAHPDCEIVITVPPEARRVRVGFGLLPGAYSGAEGQTDGVQFSVILQAPDGRMRYLASRWLTPASRIEDRGNQFLEVLLPAAAEGELILRTDPGPAGLGSFDWAYWSFVAID